jgi:hypothetical protein
MPKKLLLTLLYTFATPFLPMGQSNLVLHLPLWSRSSPGGQGLLGAMMMLVWDTLCIGICGTRLQNINSLLDFLAQN